MESQSKVTALHKRLYRIYYTTYSDDLNKRVIETLKERYGIEPVYFKSIVLPEFRFLELHLSKPGLEKEIASLVSSIVGSSYIKVDWIDTEA